MLARQFHDWSARRHGPFQSVALSTLDDGLAASDLFGHEIGAYTDAKNRRKGCFASAEHGTRFLDEIGKASKALQQKLLHVIETGEFRSVGSDIAVKIDVRVVAATNVPLEELVAKHGFLDDLRARLAYFRVRLPPLRERRADIPALILDMLATHAPVYGYHDVPAMDPTLLAVLCRAPWPDNLRQLDATVQRLLIDAEGAAEITVAHCDDDLAVLADRARDEESKKRGGGRLTRERLSDVMARVNNNKSEAARVLGVDRTTVHRTLRRFGGRLQAPLDSSCVSGCDERHEPAFSESTRPTSAAHRAAAPHGKMSSAHCGATTDGLRRDDATLDKNGT